MQSSEGRGMKTSIWRTIVTSVLAGCTLVALTAPAFGQGLVLHRDGSKAVPFVANVSSDNHESSNGYALRRDGSKAAPFVANVGTGHAGSSSEYVLRRDGSKAAPFVANVGPNAPASAGVSGWEVVAISAGAPLAMLGLGGAVVVSRRRSRRQRPASAPNTREHAARA
jgi:hypothetical protein